VTAAVGMSVGFGFYFPAIFTTILILVLLVLLRPIEMKLFHRYKAKGKVETADAPEIQMP
jgi:putative Mg2+ transporter-C (MgtC) family protein